MGPDPPSGVPRRRTRRAHLAVWSPERRHWGDSQTCPPARRPRGGTPTDRTRAAAAPDRPGRAVGYHGVRVTVSGSTIGSGLALLDRNIYCGDATGNVGLRTGHDLRAIGRLPRRRVPVRLGPRRRRRHGPELRAAAPSSASRPPASTTSSSTCRTTRRSRVGGATARLRVRVSAHAPRLPWPQAGTASLEQE